MYYLGKDELYIRPQLTETSEGKLAEELCQLSPKMMQRKWGPVKGVQPGDLGRKSWQR